MYNVIIFGTGQTSRVVRSGLSADVNIVAYCDNNNAKWNTIFNGKVVIPPYEIVNYKYDCIIIASQFNDEIYNQLIEMGVDSKNIFQFFKYIDMCWNYVEDNLHKIRNNRDVEVIATGISYMVKAIDTGVFKRKIYNLAHASQDMYFDYNLIRYLLNNNKDNLVQFKHSIIGLCYYSFEYDMSLSSMKTRVPLYYESIGVKHNLKDIDSYIKDYSIIASLGKKILKYKRDGDAQLNWFKEQSNIYKISNDKGKEQALLDGNKNYPETVKENTQILKDYLQLLKDNNIKPIVVVCPVTKYYSKYFPQRLKDEFHSIIHEVNKEYEFQFLDYFDCDLFQDDDFYDVSHLNDKGAEKFTELLNNKIEW